MTTPLLPTLQSLPATLPLEGAISIELQEGIPIFRASSIVQNRIEALLAKQQISSLNPEEDQELDGYEEIDDYLSFLNRLARAVNKLNYYNKFNLLIPNFWQIIVSNL